MITADMPPDQSGGQITVLHEAMAKVLLLPMANAATGGLVQANGTSPKSAKAPDAAEAFASRAKGLALVSARRL
ncbi:hypothetical protein HYPDE_36778 [Hyphomicrobium denitrificans 1NES1]|uniref:Uncharacterized protein n=1 Tax=Hyphomicrobium denitrificans 1NES1 TaxID=670307 RepID=N0B9X9_9HYPH|nr:hypothetical protein HYPDE_36778 [Hyphomicrobium denitrificans 1NES1]